MIPGRPPSPTPAEAARILAAAKIQRKDQHLIFKELIEKYRGKVPIYVLYQHRAIRLEDVMS